LRSSQGWGFRVARAGSRAFSAPVCDEQSLKNGPGIGPDPEAAPAGRRGPTSG